MSIFFINPQTYGTIRWFAADRCFNTEQIRTFNQHKIDCEELVSFDCGLFELQEVKSPNDPVPSGAEQILEVITRPGKTKEASLEQQGFTFCGYDLVEEFSGISAITDCGGSFRSIRYEGLTEFGLIPTYKEAVMTQLAIAEEDPYDSHADCEILEIWRKLI